MATEHDIVRRGYLNVVRNPKDGVVSRSGESEDGLMFQGLI